MAAKYEIESIVGVSSSAHYGQQQAGGYYGPQSGYYGQQQAGYDQYGQYGQHQQQQQQNQHQQEEQTATVNPAGERHMYVPSFSC